MDNEESFRDLYEVLEVEFQCGERTLELAYHRLAKVFHPDNRDTGDVARFGELVDAYKTLRNPRLRGEYDVQYRRFYGHDRIGASAWRSELDPVAGASDGEVHERILRRLYKRRRECGSEPGEGEYALQEMVGCSEAEFEFHAWYLKAKGLIEITETGTFAITVAGVDAVIATSRDLVRENLRLTSSTPTLD